MQTSRFPWVGRVAEEMIFGYDKVTSGASGDIQMATRLAHAMATQYGMSDELGPLLYSENEGRGVSWPFGCTPAACLG